MITLPIAKSGNKITLAPSKIIAIGLNYLDHIKERVVKESNIPAEPIVFAKTPNSLVESGSPIVFPAILNDYTFEEPRTDLEAELAVIISKRGRNIPKEKAYEYVLGYTCFNDVSQRNIQRSDPAGWFRGKSFDTFSPIGPVVVLHADIGDPQKLRICSRINGEVKQDGNTCDMIFSIPVLISYISRNFTLEEGDIIATGTPAGVSPIKPGDNVEIEIEGIGILHNTVVMES